MTQDLDQFGDYQNEIYLNGLSGVLPTMPMTFPELEVRAQATLRPDALSYTANGAGDEFTQRANVTAFAQWGLVPRMLVGAVRRELSVAMFGLKLSTPLFMAPIGVLGLCIQDGHGDLAAARAAAHTGIPMVASTLSVDPLEEVAAEFGETPGFLQLYTPTDRALAESRVQRAEVAGFKGGMRTGCESFANVSRHGGLAFSVAAPSIFGGRHVSPRRPQAPAMSVQPAPQVGATLQPGRRRGLFAVRGLRRTTQLCASKDAMTVERRKLDIIGGCGAGGGGW
jgi:hypothetical protein